MPDLFFAAMDRFFDDMEADELRAEARLERQRMHGHWCETCHGFTQPGSPCAPEEDEDEESGDA
ncbi:MAG TPA: hypothetical protein VFM98_03445 [Ramlibacter sp.]|uniref:hypothetical protein n=1 Tax=Ramlibacter sp. TaxID=1917967 RepID=UPI002D807A3C|nr:hypothetical protein [Ramlibacter sp.]HET8744634.1 hypothetical protein [Ramlibacter sp.]